MNDLAFVLEDLNSADTLIAQSQRIFQYLITDHALQALVELKKQAGNYDTTYRLVESIKKAKKSRQEFELLVKWLGFDAKHRETRGPLGNLKEDMPGVPKTILQTAGDRSLKRQNINLYF